MITGFEDLTAPLNELELSLMRPILKGLSTKLGRGSAITNKKIVAAMRAAGFDKVDEPRVRKIINHIRVNNLLPRLVATSKGYYIAQDVKDLARYAQSLEDRLRAISAVKQSVDKDLADMKQQLKDRTRTMNMFVP